MHHGFLVSMLCGVARKPLVAAALFFLIHTRPSHTNERHHQKPVAGEGKTDLQE